MDHKVIYTGAIKQLDTQKDMLTIWISKFKSGKYGIDIHDNEGESHGNMWPFSNIDSAVLAAKNLQSDLYLIFDGSIQLEIKQ